ncbi:MAG: A/G-specific adenine glycosylase [Defluviitaleaceae bacterium]|nr:A/G-specific adenine glycosylase [Defluviitaleaceae bacterium]
MHRELLAWYAAEKRSFPWRDNPTPYNVWVSEVMAQQTRMAQLLPFYERFMARFPTLDNLGNCDLDEVLSVFAGMGYYARARNLHAAARIILEEYGSKRNGKVPSRIDWPQTREAWEALPGVGPYTAGAIMSIAFGQRETAVDGNVLRLAARLTDDDTDISTPLAKKHAADYITSLMSALPADDPTLSPGALTQALMELGSLICTPTNPRCEICPIPAHCRARINGRERALPVKAKKKPSPVIPVTVLLIYSPEGRVLMKRRTEGLLKGMWVYYLIEGDADVTSDLVGQKLKSMGYTSAQIERKCNARHTFTHRIWDMTCYEVHIKENHAIEDYRFITPDEATKLALPAAMKYFT